jgi:hypothetical protein
MLGHIRMITPDKIEFPNLPTYDIPLRDHAVPMVRVIDLKRFASAALDNLCEYLSQNATLVCHVCAKYRDTCDNGCGLTSDEWKTLILEWAEKQNETN